VASAPILTRPSVVISIAFMFSWVFGWRVFIVTVGSPGALRGPRVVWRAIAFARGLREFRLGRWNADRGGDLHDWVKMAICAEDLPQTYAVGDGDDVSHEKV
jgi:hypothetical protein